MRAFTFLTVAIATLVFNASANALVIERSQPEYGNSEVTLTNMDFSAGSAQNLRMATRSNEKRNKSRRFIIGNLLNSFTPEQQEELAKNPALNAPPGKIIGLLGGGGF